MSNYYISKCCGVEAKYISSGQKEAIGQCVQCKEITDLELVIDDFKERADNNDLTNK